MKFFQVLAVAFLAVVFLAIHSDAAPAESDDAKNYVSGITALSQLGTCDVLSFLDVKHTACAAHCLILGNQGGYCDSTATCICR
ncbi:defensin-1-like [Stomoxys calcitrans]|uniref:defensin-1-like n=1 Tax=Stomoxys calcitrans TaxID=35570 RepID=UPI0027E22597|nr:defensin-1-like [Stomoxys calcitrans]